MGAAAMTGIVGSALGAGTNLIGGSVTTAMQNKANKDIAQMNNAFNEKMLDKQLNYNKEMYQQQLGDQWKFYNDAKDNSWKVIENQQQYQTDMWNKQNEYNSPTAQRERLEAAGLNPYMMMNGGSAGVAGTVGGTSGSSPGAPNSPSAQGVQPPTATPYSADYSGVTLGLGRAIDTLMGSSERSVKDAQASNLRIEGKYIAGKALAEILKMRTEAKTQQERIALDKLIASIDGDLKASQIAVNDSNINKIKAETQLAVTENLMRQKELEFLPQAQKLQLSQGAADIALKYANKNLTEKQARHEIEKLAETVVRANGQAMQNQYDADTYKNRVRIVEETLWNLFTESDKFGLVRSVTKFGRNLYGAGKELYNFFSK